MPSLRQKKTQRFWEKKKLNWYHSFASKDHTGTAIQYLMHRTQAGHGRNQCEVNRNLILRNNLYHSHSVEHHRSGRSVLLRLLLHNSSNPKRSWCEAMFSITMGILWFSEDTGNNPSSSVPDPWHFETDPDPWIRTLAYGSSSGSGSCFFREWLSRCQQKISLFFIFFYLLLTLL